MSKFIQLKSKNFKIVNIDTIKRIEQFRDNTRLRYIFTDGSEFAEIFETEEEIQVRIKTLKEKLMGEISIGINLNQKPINSGSGIEENS